MTRFSFNFKAQQLSVSLSFKNDVQTEPIGFVTFSRLKIDFPLTDKFKLMRINDYYLNIPYAPWSIIYCSLVSLSWSQELSSCCQRLILAIEEWQEQEEFFFTRKRQTAKVYTCRMRARHFLKMPPSSNNSYWLLLS